MPIHSLIVSGDDEPESVSELASRALGKPHEQRVPYRTLLEPALRSSGGLLVVTGQYSPVPREAVRVGVIGAGRCVVDAWIDPAEVAPLCELIGQQRPVRRGEWDVMYATDWSYAWTTDRPPLEVRDHQGRLLWQDGDTLRIRDRGFVARASVVRVEAFLSADWVTRSVRLGLIDGSCVVVAEEEDPISQIDPTYDAINISCEAAWTVSLGQALSAALVVPFEKDEVL